LEQHHAAAAAGVECGVREGGRRERGEERGPEVVFAFEGGVEL
jgi:hypothetical protein